MNEKENHVLEGYRRGRSVRDILSCRQILNTLVFLGFMVNYMLRVNLTFAIVDMVKKSEDKLNLTLTSANDTAATVATISQSIRANTSLNPLDNRFSSRRLHKRGVQLSTPRGPNLDEDADNEDELNFADDLISDESQIHTQFVSNNDTLLFPNDSSAREETHFRRDNVIRFDWSESQVGYVLGSFFWGYVCTEIPGGRLAEVIGARKVFGYATMGASVLTLIAPLSAKISFGLLLVNRILLGAFLGPTWPAILPLAGKWIPPDERGKFLSNMMASTLGAGFTLPVCGFIIGNSSWEYVFYLTGLVGFVWSICWFLLVYDSPASHPRISDEERFYIEAKLGVNTISATHPAASEEENQVVQALIRDRENTKKDSYSPLSDDECPSSKSKKQDYTSVPRSDYKNGVNGDAAKDEMHVLQSLNSPSNRNLSYTSIATKDKNVELDKRLHPGHGKAPWTSILKSVPVWAFVLTHGASVFGYFTITNQLPTFMKHILNYNIKENGVLSGLPYFGKYISAVIGGSIADYLIRSSTLSRNTVRKMFTCIGVMVPGFIMVVQIFLGSNKVLSIIIFTLALVANGFVTGGYLGNSLELAPNFSGTIFGLANMLSGFCGSLSAFLVGFLTENNQVYGQWQKVFGIVAALYFIGGLTFLFFGSTKIQPWDSLDENRKNRNSHHSMDR